MIVHLPLVDFPAEHFAMSKVLKTLDRIEVVTIERKPIAPAGSCYFSASLAASEEPDARVELGWMISWVPNVYIQAMHHAVVRYEDGYRIDVTQPEWPGAMALPHTTFVPDERPQPEGVRGVPTRFFALRDDPDISGFVTQYSENLRRKIALQDLTLRATAAGPIQQQAIESDLAAAMKASFDQLHLHRQRLLDRYFPEGLQAFQSTTS